MNVWNCLINNHNFSAVETLHVQIRNVVFVSTRSVSKLSWSLVVFFALFRCWIIFAAFSDCRGQSRNKLIFPFAIPAPPCIPIAFILSLAVRLSRRAFFVVGEISSRVVSCLLDRIGAHTNLLRRFAMLTRATTRRSTEFSFWLFQFLRPVS